MIHHEIVYNDSISMSEELEIHTINAFGKLEKFIGNDNVNFRTTYSKEGDSFKVHSHGFHNGVQFDAHAMDNDLYNGVDVMIHKLESQLRKEKEKRTSVDRNVDVVTFDDNEEE